MLVWSLSLMGVATALIGLTPTYDQIGIWAPILLMVLRFFRACRVGGEWGGAVLLAVEHSAGDRRGFHGSWPQMGVPAGCCCRRSCLRRSRRGFPSRRFSRGDGGYRFCSRSCSSASACSFGFGCWSRRRSRELKDARRESRMPLLDVFREYPREVLIGMGIRFAQNLVFYIYTVFVLSYGEKTLGYPRSVMLRGVMIASFIGLLGIPFWSHLSDRIGRRPVLLAGGICLAGRSPFRSSG